MHFVANLVSLKTADLLVIEDLVFCRTKHGMTSTLANFLLNKKFSQFSNLLTGEMCTV